MRDTRFVYTKNMTLHSNSWSSLSGDASSLECASLTSNAFDLKDVIHLDVLSVSSGASSKVSNTVLNSFKYVE